MRSLSPRSFALASVSAWIAFGTLAVLVAEGSLNGADAYAGRHWMPYPKEVSNPSFNPLAHLLGLQSSYFPLDVVVRTVVGPWVGGVLMAGFVLVLWQRGRPALGIFWMAAFVAANLGEGVVKHLLSRPEFFITKHGATVPAGFINTFPSGHATRGALLAIASVSLWRRVWPLVAAWFAAVVISIEIDGEHTPSDLLGGAFLAASLIFCVLAVDRQWGAAVDRRLPAWPLSSRPGVRALS